MRSKKLKRKNPLIKVQCEGVGCRFMGSLKKARSFLCKTCKDESRVHHHEWNGITGVKSDNHRHESCKFCDKVGEPVMTVTCPDCVLGGMRYCGKGSLFLR